MNKKRLMKFLLITGFLLSSVFCLLSFVLCYAQENLTITTYYPSPYGSYNELQLYPHAAPVTVCNANTKGTMYYNSIDNQIHICDGAGNWPVIGGGGGFWAASPTDPNSIYNTNSGNVGIGTTNPDAALDVIGAADVFEITKTAGAATDPIMIIWGDTVAGVKQSERFRIRRDGTVSVSNYQNCGALGTDASGNLTCVAGGGGVVSTGLYGICIEADFPVGQVNFVLPPAYDAAGATGCACPAGYTKVRTESSPGCVSSSECGAYSCYKN